MGEGSERCVRCTYCTVEWMLDVVEPEWERVGTPLDWTNLCIETRGEFQAKGLTRQGFSFSYFSGSLCSA